MLYLDSMAPIIALEQMRSLSVTHSAEPEKFFRRLRKAASAFFGGSLWGRKRKVTEGEPILEQVAPFVAHPELRQYITVRKKPPEDEE